MKILQVISGSPLAYAYGGPVKVAYEISKELVKSGHEVTMYTTDVHDAQSRFKYDTNPMWMDGIEVYHFKNVSNKLAYRKNLATAPMMALALKRNINDFDIVHLHEYRSFQAILVHRYAKKHGIPYVLQPRGAVPRMSKSKQKELFDFLFGRPIFEDANKIIASSKFESNQYWGVFPELKNEKIVHIPNGIELETYQNLPQKGEFKKKYSINADENIILFLSRIHEIKGANILVEAFSELKSEFENVKLVIAGPDGGYLDKLKSIVRISNIEGDVIFPGPLYEMDKFKAYVDADVFVLPSRYESFGNVALEAVACGTPSVITNVCGISEWLGRGAAIIVKPEANALYQGILKILKNERLRNHMIERAKQSAFSLSWSEVVKRIEEVYADVMQNK